jgi:hypothetical protein
MMAIGLRPRFAIAKEVLLSIGLQEQVNLVNLHIGYVDSLPETEAVDAATLILVLNYYRLLDLAK